MTTELKIIEWKDRCWSKDGSKVADSTPNETFYIEGDFLGVQKRTISIPGYSATSATAFRITYKDVRWSRDYEGPTIYIQNGTEAGTSLSLAIPLDSLDYFIEALHRLRDESKARFQV